MERTDSGYSYEQIDDLVIAFQSGDKDSAQLLIQAFEPYLKKFLRMIKDGLINLEDKDSRRFIGLFVNNYDARRKLIKSYQPSDARHKAYTASTMLTDLCRDMSYEDVMQELSMVLLIMAKRWQKKGKKINFCGYLYNTFRYETYRRINGLIGDPLVYRADMNLSYNDDSYLNEEDGIESHPNVFIQEHMMVMDMDDELGNSWVRGLTCGDAFTDLTPLQRVIIRMSFDEGQSDVEISERTGLHRNTIAKYLDEAVAIIKKSRGERNEND